ncbi:MAG: leucine-rich repeat domain-containing protein [Clostridia bacterium]|nr:leucine-rich repeat domain-containing protein [Clostridia bacterium]
MEEKDFIIENGVLVKYVGTSNEVVVPEGVTAIGQCAFLARDTLTAVVLPEGVWRVDYQAFFGCVGLTSVSIPSTLREIERPAFGDCERLRHAYYENGKYLGNDTNPYLYFDGPTEECGETFRLHPDVKVIGYRAFDSQRDLVRISIPEGVTAIAMEAFRKCSSLTAVSLPETLTHLGFGAFHKCGALSEVEIPPAVTEIGGNAFRGCKSIRTLTIPAGVGELAPLTFSGCESLCEITLPSGIERIGMQCFDGCRSLKEITLPSALKVIVSGAFKDCVSLREITLPSGVEEVDDQAFYGCSALSSVTTEATLRRLGAIAFGKCGKLRLIRCPEPQSIAEGKSPFYACPRAPSWYFKHTSDFDLRAAALLHWFENESDNLDPAPLRHLRENKRALLLYFTRRGDVEAIDRLGAASGVLFTIDELDEAIDTSEDPATTATLLDYKNKHYSQEEVERFASDKVDVALGIKEPSDEEIAKLLSLKSVSDGYVIGRYRGIYRDLRVPSHANGTPLIAIGQKAFYHSEITSIRLPSTVTAIYAAAFAHCPNLTEIDFPEGLRHIGYRAFYGCLNLKTITLPATLEHIEEQALRHCSSLENIRYRGTKADWAKVKNYIDRYVSLATTVVHCTDGDVSYIGPYDG